MERLQPFLEGQSTVFEFDFDWKAWEADREGYLVSLGVEPVLVREALTDSNHRFHIPPSDESEGVGVVITLDDSMLLDMRDVPATWPAK